MKSGAPIAVPRPRTAAVTSGLDAGRFVASVSLTLLPRFRITDEVRWYDIAPEAALRLDSWTALVTSCGATSRCGRPSVRKAGAVRPG